MKIGLYFGSFNPIHCGHLIVAQQMLQAAKLEEIWFVLSPQNPLKLQSGLVDEKIRIQLLSKAISDNGDFAISDIEFEMPRPSYTIDTMLKLNGLFPQHQFGIIMGSDNLVSFEQWKSFDVLCRDYEIHIYLRGSVDQKWRSFPKITFYELPYIHISATYIREKARKGEDIRYLVPDAILDEVMRVYGPSA
jgi:nicotinate-nucleotide adenylyltransferase